MARYISVLVPTSVSGEDQDVRYLVDTEAPSLPVTAIAKVAAPQGSYNPMSDILTALNAE